MITLNWFTGSRKKCLCQLYTFDYMKPLLLSGYIIINTIASNGPRAVYICNNKHTNKYHYLSTCRGLSNCQYKLLKSDELSAQQKGMSLCVWENRARRHGNKPPETKSIH
ncbi:hypothetical protein SAMN05443550_11738 [Pedobacter hartonius]|uniref:Uncharacterized protein n=1 Tax=Pedobacter hartonius TaxID=425514 RepID=A0A1H4HFU9_9SPHI|nr:hypothetical protein SAMN05443550_11738 [Pedobacter hartonius]